MVQNTDFPVDHNVLMTGASGYLGGHVLNHLLASRQPTYHVHAVVRSIAKLQQVTRAHPKEVEIGQLSFSIVPDFTKPHAFESAFSKEKAGEEVPFVIHTASPMDTEEVENVERDLLKPAIKGTENLLEAAKKKGTVKRFELTSHYGAVMEEGGQWKLKTFTEMDWNPITYEQAKKASPDVAYRAAKALAERATWSFVEKSGKPFELTVMCPAMLMGPSPWPQSAVRHTLTSVRGSIKSFMAAVYPRAMFTPPTKMPFYVDVRDAALAHLRGIQVAQAADQRFLLSGGRMFWAEVVEWLRGNPEFSGSVESQKLGLGEEDEQSRAHMEGPVAAVDPHKAEEVLGIKFRPWEDTVADTCRYLLGLPST